MKNFVFFFFLVLIQLIYTNLIAAPVNDSCSKATFLTIKSYCEFDTISTLGATAEPTSVAASPCGFYMGSDVWFKFVVPASGSVIFQVIDYPGSIWSFYSIYTGTCGSFSLIGCYSGTKTIGDTGLAGDTLYLRIWGGNSSTGGSVKMCLWEPVVPVNNDCALATVLQIDSTCNFDTISTAGASAQSTSVAPSPCGFYTGIDIWYKFALPASGAITIQILDYPGSIWSFYAVYSGNCGSFSALGCYSGSTTIQDTNLSGDTLYLRVWGGNAWLGGEVKMCVFEPDIPVNNNCVNATFITPGSFCSFSPYTTIGSTSEPTSVAPIPCGNYYGADVWFKTVVPASGNLRFEIKGIGSHYAQFAVYAGVCGSFNLIKCLQLDPHMNMSDTTMAGDTIYIRVFGYGEKYGGLFEFCVWEPISPVNNFCENAILLPVDSFYLFGNYCDSFYSAYSTHETNNGATYPSCGFYQGGDVWFKAIMPMSGKLRIEASGLTTCFTLYEGSCGSFTEVHCTYLDPDRMIFDTSLAGKWIYIRVYSFNSDEGGSFSIKLIEPRVPANDACANAIPISAGNHIYSNANATADATGIAPNPPSCSYRGGDVWFTYNVPSSGYVKILETDITGAGGVEMQLYSGTCGSMTTVLSCQLFQNTIEFTNLTYANQTLYLRVFTYNEAEGSTFGLCGYNAGCLNIDKYNRTLPVCYCKPVYLKSNQIIDREKRICELHKAFNGDDSIIVYTPTIVPALYSRDTIGICPGDTAFLSDGFDTSGVISPFSHICNLISYLGCDSIVNTYIRINPVQTSVDSQMVCKGYTVYLPDGDSVQNVQSAFSDTSVLLSSFSCDSLIISRIQLFPAFQSLVYDTICLGGSYTFPAGHTINQITASLIDTSVVPDVNTCDSTIFTHLHVQPTYLDSVDAAICSGDSFTFPNNITVNNITSPIRDTSILTSSSGCDSMVITKLMVDSVYMVNYFDTVCSGSSYLFPDGKVLDSAISSVIDTSLLYSVSNCDSVVITFLQVNPVYKIFNSVEICRGESFVFPDLSVLSAALSDTTQVSIISSKDYCDSIVSTELNVFYVDTVVTYISGNGLEANNLNSTYQWLDCGNNLVPLSGAVNRIFFPQSNGSFAVALLENNCLDTSACFNINTITVKELSEKNGIRIYPNPVGDKLFYSIEFPERINSIGLYSSSGQLIIDLRLNIETSGFIDMNELSAGTYFVHFNSTDRENIYTIVKE